MKIKSWIGLLCALTALPALANPQNLRDAVQEAILRHPEVLSKWRLYQAAGHDADAAQAGYYPRLDAQAYAGRERYDTPSTNATSYNHPGASLELRQMLFDGFATRNEVRRAGYTRQARYYDLLATSDAIALEAVRAYQDVLRYRRLVALARENWATHKELYDQIEERVAAGVGRRVDLEQATGRMALAESNWLTETANLHDVSARYERLMGAQPAKTLAVAPAFDMPVADGGIAPEVIRNNPSFQAAVAGIRAARAEARGKDASLWPNLELRASQSVDRNTNGVDGGYNKGVVQLVLSYNLFKGGGDIARGRQYIEQLNANYDLRDKVCRDLRQSTRVAINEARRNREQLSHLQLHALSTEKAREAYRRQFDIGQRTLLDLLDTENEYFQARRSVIGAEHDLLIAQAQVLSNAHRLLPALKLAPLAETAPEAGSDDQQADEAVTCGLDVAAISPLDREAAMAERPKRPVPTPAPVKAVAAPVQAAPLPEPKMEKITLSASSLFELGLAKLGQDTSELDQLAEMLKSRPEVNEIRINGYTDRLGSKKTNLALSKKRADAVKNYLVGKGIPAERIKAVGKGSANPVSKCAGIKNRAKLQACLAPDRRIEIEPITIVRQQPARSSGRR